jgi:hypothetical protein
MLIKRNRIKITTKMVVEGLKLNMRSKFMGNNKRPKKFL